MNIHVPQGLQARTELEMLSATKHNMISAQASKPNICIVQDSLLGAYLMTKKINKLAKYEFFNICMNGDGWTPQFILDKIQHIRRVLRSLGRKAQCFNGKSLFSMLLPEDLIYEKKNDADSDEPIVKIYRGVLYEGAINKAILGTGHNTLIQILHKEYGKDIAASFVDNVQFITNAWLLINGFSIGIADCIATKSDEIKMVTTRSFIEAKGVEETTTNPDIREIKINAALSKAKDIGMKLAKDALRKDNNFIHTVTSGSKGDFFNIAQITGLLGQQNVTGKRIEPALNKGRRTLPHYPFEITDKEIEYESRGFIRHSFIRGLNPQEFWFHAASGREGITDTGMKTAATGYIQRRMIKIMEDLMVRNDNTVRNSIGSVIQFAYGDDNLDATQTVLIDGEPQAVNIGRLADRLNLNYEMENKRKKK